MKETTQHPPHRWLAQALPDETIRIERVLFKVLRDLCSGLGLSEGDVLRCRTVSETVVLLESPGGRTIVIDQEWARFIEVRTANASPLAPEPAFQRRLEMDRRGAPTPQRPRTGIGDAAARAER
jgi:hypothetical protein